NNGRILDVEPNNYVLSTQAAGFAAFVCKLFSSEAETNAVAAATHSHLMRRKQVSTGTIQTNARLISMKLLKGFFRTEAGAIFTLLSLVVVAIDYYSEPLQIFGFGQKEITRVSFLSPHKQELFLHPLEFVVPLVSTGITRFAFKIILQ